MTAAHQALAIRELGRRSTSGTFGHLLMFATAELIARGAQAFPLPILASIFIVLIGVRIVARSGALSHPERLRRNWTLLAIGALGCNTLWGVAIAGVQWKNGAGMSTIVFAFFTCAIAIGSVAALAPSKWLQRAALTGLIVPVIAMAIVGHGLFEFAILHAIFLAYTLVMGTIATRAFWANVAQHERLQEHELELRQAQKLEAIGRLAAGLAHEINTPVQFITDSCTFLAEGIRELDAGATRYRELVYELANARVTAPEALATAACVEEEYDLGYLREHLAEAAERAMQGLERVTKIVRATKDFSRHAATKSPANLNAALESTLVMCQHETGAVADVVTELGPLPLVDCHGGELNQVFLNIIINAAHAIAEQGEARGRITIRTWAPGDGWVRIAISDTGRGIPEDIRDKIFDPFFTTKPVGHGSGQGLAIARSIVVGKHHGKLDVASQPGVGTTFTIALPAPG